MKSFLAAAAVLLTTTTALADGLVGSASDLDKKARIQLQGDIAGFRTVNPAAFEAVRNVEGYRPETYRKFRNPIPLVGRELRQLGPEALLPMLHALAFDAPARNQATDREWRALKVGMLEAVAYLHDSRSAAVVQAAFANAQHPQVLRAAAEGLGALCDGSSVNQLRKSLASVGARRDAAIAGLGTCRSYEAAKVLSEELASTSNAVDASRISRAMGTLASSWAWKSFGKARQQEGKLVRELVSVSVLRSFARHADAQSREGYRFALTMAAAPQLRQLVARELPQVAQDVRAQVERVVVRIEKRSAAK